VKQNYDTVMASYESFVKDDVAALNTALTTAGFLAI